MSPKYSNSKPPRMMVCFKPDMMLVRAVTEIRLGPRRREDERMKIGLLSSHTILALG